MGQLYWQRQNWLVLRKLLPDTFYIVKVQSLSISRAGQESESSPAQLYFVTPKAPESLSRNETAGGDKKLAHLGRSSQGQRTQP
ncbi:unnamed protein product [Protopolystoma xenopodis]|uniref:Uncharacterized protein n=1 Tax=Protopolystoma xenopodis TaxID=117903 RepID=A0A448XLT5_9PLAT|nr:unnamed protein product [Protopolystoma xenopodis]